MPALGICPNVERCSKAVAKELIDLYPGIGEVCPECGRRLEAAEAAPQSSLPSSPVGFRPKYVSAAAPAAPAPPSGNGFRKVAAQNAPAQRASAPAVAPIMPVEPQETPAPAPSFAYEPNADSVGIADLLARHAAPDDEPALEHEPIQVDVATAAPAPAQAAVAEEAVTEAPQAPQAPAGPPEPPQAREAKATLKGEAPAERPEDDTRGSSWFIKPLEATNPGEIESSSEPDAKKRKPAVYAGIAVSALLALGGGYYAASNGTINVPGIPGFSTVSAAGALPATPTFRICSTTGVSEKLVPDLIRGFLTKAGAVAVDATPAKGTFSAQLPNRAPALIAVTTGDAGQAFTGLSAGACQLAVTQSAMPLKTRAAKGAIGETVLGLAGVAVVVNPANSVAQIDLEKLSKIFNGTITNWSQAGGPDQPIALIVPQAGSDEYAAFSSMVLKGASVAPAAKTVDSGAVAALVAKTPGAIGVTSLGSTAPAHTLRILARDGTAIVANPVNIGLKRYPLTTTVYLYDAAQSADPLAAQFVSFTQSDAGQAIVTNSNFIGRNSF